MSLLTSIAQSIQNLDDEIKELLQESGENTVSFLQYQKKQLEKKYQYYMMSEAMENDLTDIMGECVSRIAQTRDELTDLATSMIRIKDELEIAFQGESGEAIQYILTKESESLSSEYRDQIFDIIVSYKIYQGLM